MRKYICIVVLAISILLLSGCGEQYTEAELYQMCIDIFMEENVPEISYEIKEKYATVEETYQEILQLSLWTEELNHEIYDIFSDDNYRDNDSIRNIVSSKNLKWYELEEMFDKLESGYRKDFYNKANGYLSKIIEVSCKEIQDRKQELCTELDDVGLNYIARAEKERVDGEYRWMFVICSNEAIPKEIMYTLFPEELYQGAVECIQDPITEYNLDKVKIFMTELGEYNKYEDDIKKAYVRLENSKKEEESGNKKPSSNKPTSTKNKKDTPNDPYDVYDYSDPEDFYYDWEEDFDGYEDAEDYWYDAWDEVE